MGIALRSAPQSTGLKNSARVNSPLPGASPCSICLAVAEVVPSSVMFLGDVELGFDAADEESAATVPAGWVDSWG